MGNGGFMISTPRGMQAFRLLQWKYALKIQYDTGLGHSRGSVPKFVAQHFGMKYRTRKDIPALIERIDYELGLLDNAIADERGE